MRNGKGGERRLGPEDVRRLARETMHEERAILRWWSGLQVRPSTARALDTAAEKLGIKR
jgi:hypothetical protein